jgi:hypothetical protein
VSWTASSPLFDKNAAVDPAVVGPVHRYLALVDKLLSGRVVGFYLVGSSALWTFRPGQSDIDFVAVTDRRLTQGELRRLRVVHAIISVEAAVRALRHPRVTPGSCNGAFVERADLCRPVTSIAPIASHVAQQFHIGRAFDVNPVVWQQFALHGIAVRGPDPHLLGLDPEPELLARWNVDNLRSYWRPWAARLAAGPTLGLRLRPRWTTAWGVLGASRLHYTIATGEVISKEAAGLHALEVFDRRWRPIIEEAMAFRDGQSTSAAYRRDIEARARDTAAFVLAVIDDAERLATTHGGSPSI